MNQIALALEHYWHLRVQGLGAVAASEHVERRFGVRVPPSVVEHVADECEEIVQAVSTDFGTEFTNTIWGTSTGPVDGLRAAAIRRVGCSYCMADDDPHAYLDCTCDE